MQDLAPLSEVARAPFRFLPSLATHVNIPSRQYTSAAFISAPHHDVRTTFGDVLMSIFRLTFQTLNTAHPVALRQKDESWSFGD